MIKSSGRAECLCATSDFMIFHCTWISAGKYFMRRYDAVCARTWSSFSYHFSLIEWLEIHKFAFFAALFVARALHAKAQWYEKSISCSLRQHDIIDCCLSCANNEMRSREESHQSVAMANIRRMVMQPSATEILDISAQMGSNIDCFTERNSLCLDTLFSRKALQSGHGKGVYWHIPAHQYGQRKSSNWTLITTDTTKKNNRLEIKKERKPTMARETPKKRRLIWWHNKCTRTNQSGIRSPPRRDEKRRGKSSAECVMWIMRASFICKW